MAWIGVAGLLALLAVLGFVVPADWATKLDWQPARVWPEWWRVFSAIAVHYSALHLLANLLGALAVAALGWAADLPARCALAWLLAWPLTQLGLAMQPALLHYGGLSGVLHAGVAIAALFLVWRAQGRRRLIGGALLIGLLAKLMFEQPWGAPLREVPGWDIALAPLAHASGTLAGLGCGLLLEWRASCAPGRGGAD